MSLCVYKDLHKTVHSSLVHNSQSLQTIRTGQSHNGTKQQKKGKLIKPTTNIMPGKRSETEKSTYCYEPIYTKFKNRQTNHRGKSQNTYIRITASDGKRT